jgi:hypothetical protein
LRGAFQEGELRHRVDGASAMDFLVEAVVEKRFPKSGTKAYWFWDIPSLYK